MNTRLVGSTFPYDSPNEYRDSSWARSKNLVNVLDSALNDQDSSDDLEGDWLKSIDDFIQFPNTLFFEQPGPPSSVDSAPNKQCLLDTSCSQNGSSPSCQLVEFTLSVDPSESLQMDSNTVTSPVMDSGPVDPDVPLLKKESVDPIKTSTDLVVTPKRRGRKRKQPLSPEEQVVKRRNFLERNRTAATRCRQRKKAEIGKLKARRVELQRTNTQLVIDSFELTRELERLNSTAMSCGSCSRRRSIAIDDMRDSKIAFVAKSRALLDSTLMFGSEDGSGEGTSSMSKEP